MARKPISAFPAPIRRSRHRFGLVCGARTEQKTTLRLKDKQTGIDDSLAHEKWFVEAQPGLFLGFRLKPLINPQLSLLYDVFLCVFLRSKHVAASDDDIMKTEFFSELNVGSRCPCASAFISINRG